MGPGFLTPESSKSGFSDRKKAEGSSFEPFDKDGFSGNIGLFLDLKKSGETKIDFFFRNKTFF